MSKCKKTLNKRYWKIPVGKRYCKILEIEQKYEDMEMDEDVEMDDSDKDPDYIPETDYESSSLRKMMIWF